MRRIFELRWRVCNALLALALGAALSGCGGGGGGGGSISGTIGGMPVSVSSAISGDVTVGFIITIQGTGIVLTNVPNACTELMGGGDIRNSQALELLVYVSDSAGTMPATAPGTFPIGASGDGNHAIARFLAKDASCNTILSSSAVSGTVTVSSVANGSLAGSFSLVMDTNDTITGTFGTAYCSAIASVASGRGPDGGAPVCH